MDPLEEIERLEALVAEREARKRGEEDEPPIIGHLRAQIRRLEDTVLKLERRLLGAEAGPRARQSMALVHEDQRAIRKKIRNVNRKAKALREELEGKLMESRVRIRDRTVGAHARLRRALRDLVVQIRSDPDAHPSEARPYQQRITELMRARRSALDEAESRARDARNYVADSVDLLKKARTANPDAETFDAGASSQVGTARQRLAMAEMVKQESRRRLEEVAGEWPELNQLLLLKDWDAIPLARLQQLLEPPNLEELSGHLPVARLDRGIEQARAIALWLEELRGHIEKAPLPSNK